MVSEQTYRVDLGFALPCDALPCAALPCDAAQLHRLATPPCETALRRSATSRRSVSLPSYWTAIRLPVFRPADALQRPLTCRRSAADDVDLQTSRRRRPCGTVLPWYPCETVLRSTTYPCETVLRRSPTCRRRRRPADVVQLPPTCCRPTALPTPTPCC